MHRRDDDITIVQIVQYSALGYIIADMSMFVAWIISGQSEPEGWYLGRITTEIVRAILL